MEGEKKEEEYEDTMKGSFGLGDKGGGGEGGEGRRKKGGRELKARGQGKSRKR